MNTDNNGAQLISAQRIASVYRVKIPSDERTLIIVEQAKETRK